MAFYNIFSVFCLPMHLCSWVQVSDYSHFAWKIGLLCQNKLFKQERANETETTKSGWMKRKNCAILNRLETSSFLKANQTKQNKKMEHSNWFRIVMKSRWFRSTLNYFHSFSICLRLFFFRSYVDCREKKRNDINFGISNQIFVQVFQSLALIEEWI